MPTKECAPSSRSVRRNGRALASGLSDETQHRLSGSVTPNLRSHAVDRTSPPPRFAALAPFRHGPYARLWTGAFVSNIGTWMESIALGIYVTDRTGQAAWTGAVAAAAFLPIAFFGPLG